MKYLVFFILFISLSHAVPTELIEFNRTIDEVAATLNEKEAHQLYQFKNEINAEVELVETIHKKKSQTMFGKIFSQAGLFVGKIHTSTVKPFANAAGWLSGFFNKVFKKKNKNLAKLSSEYLNEVQEGALFEGNSEVDETITKIKEGKYVSAAQLNRLFELAPQYRYRFYEKVITHATRYTVPSILLAITKTTLVKIPFYALAVVDVAYIASILPCAKFPPKNENLAIYCKKMYDHYITEVHLARVKGYIKGLNRKNKIRNKRTN